MKFNLVKVYYFLLQSVLVTMLVIAGFEFKEVGSMKLAILMWLTSLSLCLITWVGDWVDEK